LYYLPQAVEVALCLLEEHQMGQQQFADSIAVAGIAVDCHCCFFGFAVAVAHDGQHY
jgi:hypothetical protein